MPLYGTVEGLSRGRCLMSALCSWQVEEGWWEGVANGKTGLFPSNFVELLDEEPETEKIGEFLPASSPRRPSLLPGCVFPGSVR